MLTLTANPMRVPSGLPLTSPNRCRRCTCPIPFGAFLCSDCFWGGK